MIRMINNGPLTEGIIRVVRYYRFIFLSTNYVTFTIAKRSEARSNPFLAEFYFYEIIILTLFRGVYNAKSY